MPLAGIQLAVGGKRYSLEVAVTEGLAYDALLGRDIPELNELAERFDKRRAQEALAVTTRAQAQREALEEKELQKKQSESEVRPHTLMDDDGLENSDAEEVTDTEEELEVELLQGHRKMFLP